MSILRNHLPNRAKEKKKFSQGALALEFLDSADVEGAHNAVNDVRVLHKLINTLSITEDIIKNNARNVSAIVKQRELLANKTLNTTK